MLHNSRFLSVVACKKCVRSNLPSTRALVSIALMILLFAGSIPPAIASSLAREAVTRSSNALESAGMSLSGWLRSFKGNKSGAQGPPNSRGVKPGAAESKTDREARAASLQMNPSDNVVLQSRQPMLFTAIPLDRDGNAIHGLHAEWESSDKQVIFIKKTGQAIAGKPGRATLTAKAGQKKETVRVVVVDGTKENFGGKKKQDSTRAGRKGASNVSVPNSGSSVSQNGDDGRRHHARKTDAAMMATAPPLPMRDPSDDPLPDNETNSLYQAANAVGTPPGRKRAGAVTPSVIASTENGNKNFSFALPIVNLPGRGLDVSLSLVHNSQTWNKSASGGSTYMSYDVDSSWPAAGWRLSLGQIEDQGSYGFTLTDADGTRHALVHGSGYNYDTTDGTFIHYYGGSGWGSLYYPDGTIAYYGAAGGGYRAYPTQITDRNGNYILIGYVSGVGPKISSIEDTLGRYLTFYYASNGDLVTITAPGLTGNADRQVMRFYYEDISLSTGIFDSSITVPSSETPTTVHTLKYAYLPSSSDGSGSYTGYLFDYRTYGVMYQVTQFRGMTVSTTSTSSAGTVSTEGSQAARSTYDYPASPTGLTDLPTYSTRTDEWAGRTTSGGAPYYTFSTNESTGVSTVTAPDGTVSESHAIVDVGQWDDGLVSDSYVKDGSTTLTHTQMDWQLDSGSANPRVYQVRSTDVAAGLTKGTVLSYTTSYNNVSSVSERDFTTDGSISSIELRHTDTTYINSSSYTNRHLLHLPSTVQVFPGGSSTPAARVDYGYDDYGGSHANLTARDDIIMHDPAFDPFQPDQENCDWECVEWGYTEGGYYGCLDTEWVCHYYNPYNSTTDYRGNVTSVTTYPDATSSSGTITHSTTYDIAGNAMTAQVDCCQQKSLTYWSSNGSYAYPISVTSGNPSGTHVTSSATFDYNSGLPATTTDENSQITTNYYNSDSLRLDHVTYPDSGATYLVYSDGLSAGHFYVETSSKLDANGSGGSTRYIDSYRYFDGRGAVTRTMSNHTSADGYTTQDIEYDTMGRAYRASNPYYASSLSASINSDGFWTTSTFDHLGRVTQVTMPRGDNDNSLTTNVQTSFDGVFTTVTDQAGKVRRQKVDAFGRVIRLDEPTSSGLGSTSSPNQAANYYYDSLDNLVRINQGSQNRYFKFDSLSRLIRERQVEQTTNSSYDLSDSLTGNSSWTRKVEYNSSGLVTNAYDARGVHTTLSYDDLNRVTQISYSDSTPTAHYYYDSQSLPSGAPSYAHGSATGQLIAMTYGSGATGNYFGYDTMGRVNVQKQVTGSATYGLSYTYNYAGLLTGEAYPSTRALAYHYDDGGRLSQVDDGTTTFANSYAYSAHGGLASETFGNTAVHTMTYNRRLQASQVKLNLSSTVLQQYDYGYGQFNTSSGDVDTSKNNGQIGKVLGTIGTTAQWNQGFSYDELGRLSNVVEHQGSSMFTQTYSQSYTFDRYGNRFQSANSTLGLIGVSSSDYDTTNNNNRFVSSVATYDAAGNILSDAKFRGMNYSYDANGRMTYAYHSDSIGGTDAQTSVYDCAGQRVQISANNVTRTMVYDIFGQLVADYLGSSGATLERENIYRGGQLLAVYETGASCYKSISQFVQDFYQGVLQRSPNSTELTNWTTTLTQAQSQGQGQLIVAAQSLGATLFTSSEYSGLSTSNGQFVTDLYAGYLGRSPDSGGYNAWLAVVNGGTSRTDVRNGFAYSTEFQNDVGQLCVTTSSSSPSLKYVLSDLQGTTRAVMNNSGSSSAVIARHDYLPFGEEVWTGRSSSNAYGGTDAIRSKYGLTERDDATGLDHTWWRKLENFSGRWTSPDPYNGSMATTNPQSFNRFAHVQNDPVNFVDPSGLLMIIIWGRYCSQVQGGDWVCYYAIDQTIDLGGGGFVGGGGNLGGGGPGGGGPGFGGNPLIPGRGPQPPTTPRKPPTPAKPAQPNKQSKEACIAGAIARFLGKQALTAVKQIAIEAGVGLGIAFALFFGAEAMAPVVEGGILISTFIRLDHLSRAAQFAGAAAFVAGKYAVNNEKDLFRNIGAAASAVKACNGLP
jgi:RHS repeat-associated protein